MDMILVTLLTFTLTSSFGWAIIAYEGYANQNGLQIGSLLSGSFSWLQGLGYIALIAPVVIAGVVGLWWHSIIVVVGANVLVRLMFPILKQNTQIIATLGVFLGLSASAFLVI